MSIKVDASSQPVDTAQVFLDFDPAALQVVDANGAAASAVEFGTLVSSGTWMQPLLNHVDNATGRIGVAAGKGTPAGGGVDADTEFVLAIVHFKALTGGVDTNIAFDVEDTQSLQRTKVYSLGTEVTGSDAGTAVSISAGSGPGPTSTPVPTAVPPTPVPPPQPVVGGGGGGFAGGYVLPTPSSSGTFIVFPTPPPVIAPAVPAPEPATATPAPPPPALVEEPQITDVQPEIAIVEAPEPAVAPAQLSEADEVQTGLEGSPEVASGEEQSGFRNLLLFLAVGLGLVGVAGTILLFDTQLRDRLLRSLEGIYPR